jgi:hypothetical protein
MSVLITGDSHSGVFARALASTRANHAGAIRVRMLGNGRHLRGDFFRDAGTHAWMVEPNFRARIQRLPLNDPAGAIRAYGFCGPLHTADLWRDKAWSAFAPAGMTRDEEKPVSAALLQRAIDSRLRSCLGLFEIFRRAGMPLFVIEAPRPFRHHPAFQAIRPEVISHVDRAYRARVCERLAEADVSVVRVPECCIDAQGFTLDQYRSERKGDIHHGNLGFGELMLDRVAQLAAEQGWLVAGATVEKAQRDARPRRLRTG